MTKFLAMCFLLAYLDKPNNDDWPPQSISNLAKIVDVNDFVGAMATRGVHFPIEEYVSNDFKHGAYNVFWRRAQGRPSDYPCDPVLGMKK